MRSPYGGAYNDIKNEYSSILSNSITLPDAALHIAPPIAGKGGFTDMYVQGRIRRND